MRVISGKYKRKQLRGFNINGTRPTMDRVKESMFAMIQNDINNAVCLDLFAGTGALGIEAISMGAKKVYFVDNNRQAIEIINNNLSGITEECVVLMNDYATALEHFKNSHITFDLIILDPPYQKEDLVKIIQTIDEYGLLNDNGILVVETTDNIEDYYECIKKKTISDKIIKIYRK